MLWYDQVVIWLRGGFWDVGFCQFDIIFLGWAYIMSNYLSIYTCIQSKQQNMQKSITLPSTALLFLVCISLVSSSEFTNITTDPDKNYMINMHDYENVMEQFNKIVTEKEDIQMRRSQLLSQIGTYRNQVLMLNDQIRRRKIQVVEAYQQYSQAYIQCQGLQRQNFIESLEVYQNSSCLAVPMRVETEELRTLQQKRQIQLKNAELNSRQLKIQNEFTIDASSTVELYADLLLYSRQKQANKKNSAFSRNIYNILNVKRVGVAKFASRQIIAYQSMKGVPQQPILNNLTDLDQVMKAKEKQVQALKIECESKVLILRQNWEKNLATLIAKQKQKTEINQKITLEFNKADRILNQLKEKTAFIGKLAIKLEQVMKSGLDL